MLYNVMSMTQYYYKALKDHKEFVEGYVEANSQREARDKVRSLGFLPTNIYEEMPVSVGAKSKGAKSLSNISLSLADKIFFTSELQVLLDSGISILDALESVAKYSKKNKISMIAKDLEFSIKAGKTFTESLEKYSKSFGEIYVALCYAGESSGTLPGVLNYLLLLLRKQESLKNKYIQMSIYPSILVIFTIAVWFLLGGLVFPKLVASLNIENVPFTVSALVNSVSFVCDYWWFLLLCIAGILYGINVVFGFGAIKKKFAQFMMSVPVLSDCVQYFSLAHYISVMHIAYDSGIPILNAMNMANSTISNDVMRVRAERAVKLVEKGESLTDAYNLSELIPPMILPLISTGEKTGKLGQMFRDASIGIEKKLDMALEALSKAFEPTLLVIISVIVGYFIIAFSQMYSEGMLSILNGI